MPLNTTTRMLAPFLGQLTDEELDAIPFGVVQLDHDGFVRSFNWAEAQNAGFTVRPLGRHFFHDVYPSADVPEFHGRFLDGVAKGCLDETFSFTYTCGVLPRRVQLRMYYCVRTSSLWVFAAKPDGSPLDHEAVTAPPVLQPTPPYGVALRSPRVAWSRVMPRD